MGWSEFSGTERFEVLSRLGSGGMGVVYEVLDRDRAARVALKKLRTPSPEALLRFKKEFRALERVQHPNLVMLGELFEDRGEWFFTTVSS
jgi:serine/threonine protein kinase